MAQKKETLFRHRLEPHLKAISRSFWVSIQQQSFVGTPDKIGCVNGFLCGLEIKKDSKTKATKLQLFILSKIRAAGGYAEVIHPDNQNQVLFELGLISRGAQTPNQIQEGKTYE